MIRIRRDSTLRANFPSRFGNVCLATLLTLLVGCGGPKDDKRKAAEQKPPPTSIEELAAKVQSLEERQRRLKRKRADIQAEFSELTRTQKSLVALRDEVLQAQRQAIERAAALKEVEARPLEAKPERKLPAVELPTPGGPGAKPFAVHTASYKSPGKALKEVNQWVAQGYGAYLSRADLGRKGIWYRVLIDRFATAREARTFARRFKELHKLRYAAPMKLPYSVALEAYPTKEDVEQAKAELKRKGVHPYVVRETGPDGTTLYRLRVGAYKKRREAEAASKEAGRAGRTTAVITP